MKSLTIGALALISTFAFSQELQYIPEPGFIITSAEEKADFDELNPIKKSRKLNSVERKQIKVLKCVRSMLKINKITDSKIQKASEIMSSLSIAKDETEITSLASNCRKQKKFLSKERPTEISLNDIKDSLNLVQEEKAKQIMKRFIFVTNECIIKRAYAQAAVVIGAKVGVGSIVCRGSDAKKRRYIGPSVGIATNFGASVGVEKVIMDMDREMAVTPEQPPQGVVNYQPTYLRQKMGRIGSISFDKTSVYSVLLGRNYNTISAGYGIRAIDSSDYSQGVNIGLSSLTGSSINVNVRFFNGRDNWEPILDILNK